VRGHLDTGRRSPLREFAIRLDSNERLHDLGVELIRARDDSDFVDRVEGLNDALDLV